MLFAGSGNTYNLNQKGLGSVTGRIGYTWGPALLYVKGGYAYSDYSELLVNVAGAPVAFTSGHQSMTGYTVGAGLEYLFTQNLVGQGRVPVLRLRQAPTCRLLATGDRWQALRPRTTSTPSRLA